MYCNNCGLQNKDGIKFCENCGAPLIQGDSVPSVTENVIDTGVVSGNTADTPLMATVRKFLTSKLFLVAIIFFCISIFASFISGVTEIVDDGKIENLFEDIMPADEYNDEYNYGYFFDNFLTEEEDEEFANGDELEDTIAFDSSSILSLAMPILMAVGFWLLYSSARSNRGQISTTGLKFIKVIQIIIFVVVEVLLAIVIVVFLLLPVLSKATSLITNEEQMLITFVVVVLGVFMFIVLAAIIVIHIFVLKGIKSAQKIIEGTVTLKGIGFVMVWCFISGISNAISSFGYITTPMFFISQITIGVAYILFGVLLSKAKKELQVFEKPVYSNYIPPEIV